MRVRCSIVCRCYRCCFCNIDCVCIHAIVKCMPHQCVRMLQAEADLCLPRPTCTCTMYTYLQRSSIAIESCVVDMRDAYYGCSNAIATVNASSHSIVCVDCSLLFNTPC